MHAAPPFPPEQKLRVLLNDRVLRAARTGVGHYAAAVLRHVSIHRPDVRVDAYSRVTHPERACDEACGSAELEARATDGGERTRASPAASAIRPGWRPPWLVRRMLERMHGRGFRRRARGYDLYHEPNHIPFDCDLPIVTTIHDLSGILHPEWHPRDRARWYEAEFEAGLRRTARFIAASEFTKRELAERFGVPAARIDVTYQAPRDAFRVQSASAGAGARADLGLGETYLVFAGTLEPRKNVAMLLDAYSALPDSLRRRCPLVLAGGTGWKTSKLVERLESCERRGEVRRLGYVDDPLLAALYGGCAALVWPTLYEGFGLPPLEAMACGAPVIASNVCSLPEVVGDAGELLDPADASAWTAAMWRAVEDSKWREEARRRSLARAALFSWGQFANATAACYEAARTA